MSEQSETDSQRGREYLQELMNEKISKALTTIPEEGEVLEEYHRYIKKIN